MLRLWRDLYRVVLHPDRVSLVRVQKGRFSKSESVSANIEVEPNTELSWQGAVRQLEQIVSSIRSIKANVEIVLSNHFVRYAVIPWSDDLMATDEMQTIVRICFEEVYGSLPEEWEIRFSDAGYGEAKIACAVDSELIKQLSGIFSGTSLRMVSVQPYLMAAFNRCRTELPDDDCLLLLNEPGRLGLIRVRNRQWSNIRQVQIKDLQDELPGLLRREMLVSGVETTSNQYVFELDYLLDDSPADKRKMISKLVTDQQIEAVMEVAQ